MTLKEYVDLATRFKTAHSQYESIFPQKNQLYFGRV